MNEDPLVPSGNPETANPASDVRPDVRLDELIAFGSADTPSDPEAARLVAALPVAVEAPRKSVLREWAESIAFVIVFILIFTGYVAQATQVPTESMKPTILVGDHFFIEKLAYPGNFPERMRPYLPQRTIRRGDVIVFKPPVPGKIPFVKRVIAVAGDTIEIKGKIVSVNGARLAEPYKIHMDRTAYEDAVWTPDANKKRDNYGPAVVPPDSFFVMGDNRDNSNDSRFWGFVRRDDIIGKPLFVYWSYEADPYAAYSTVGEWARSYLSVAAHFFTRTRWFRTGTVVE